jgi:small subunit ribosomal protein S21
MPYIVVREKQPLDLIVRRFRRICEKDALFKMINFLQSHKKPSETRKLEKALGKKRAHRRMLRDNPLLTGRSHQRTAANNRSNQQRTFSSNRPARP